MNDNSDKTNIFVIDKEFIAELRSLVEEVAIKAKYQYIEFYYKRLPLTNFYGLSNFTPHFSITGAYEGEEYNIDTTIELLNQLGSLGWRFISVMERRFAGKNSEGSMEFYHSNVYLLEKKSSEFCLDQLANILNTENIESKDTENEDADADNENIESKHTENEDTDPLSLVPIEELQLSVRAYNLLKRARIDSVKDLLDYSKTDLSEILKHRRSEEEVVETLKKRFDLILNDD
ncbi:MULTISPECIES: DNA-directed RNA polymerase subunit alpha C-terminal domain-containing protein [unclassified Microcoleus]|uniref:DNA-directed RNA polymerase subunit alpha C-terminal domain-containing protein n=1 Tax=unclassified Microcoleus TaxID=2642155 RepID=UPI002FD51DE0